MSMPSIASHAHLMKNLHSWCTYRNSGWWSPYCSFRPSWYPWGLFEWRGIASRSSLSICFGKKTFHFAKTNIALAELNVWLLCSLKVTQGFARWPPWCRWLVFWPRRATRLASRSFTCSTGQSDWTHLCLQVWTCDWCVITYQLIIAVLTFWFCNL